MAVDGDFANFRSVYDFYTDEVLRASGHFLPEHLGNWYRTLDTTSAVAPIIQRLQRGLDFKGWRTKTELAARGMGGDLTWPEDPTERLGMKLLLFRSAADAGSSDFISFLGFRFMPSSDSNVHRSATRFVEQVFGPMARELRMYLERETQKIPAADRVVPLTHNSPEYRETIEALESLEKALREANDYPDPDDKDQRIAEVSATHRLLKAVRVSIRAVVAVIGTGLLYLMSKFAGTAIDTASHWVIEKLTTLLGPYF